MYLEHALHRMLTGMEPANEASLPQRKPSTRPQTFMSCCWLLDSLMEEKVMTHRHLCHIPFVRSKLLSLVDNQEQI